MSSFVVSLIGRPNVGKSSLFNRIMRKNNLALTHNTPGVTRDLHYGLAKLNANIKHEEQEIVLIDSGGMYPEKTNIQERPGYSSQKEREALYQRKLFAEMTTQAQLAIDEADLILLVVDVREGLLPLDERLAIKLRECQKPFWVVVNKFDTDKQIGLEAQFYSLGIKENHLFCTSASHGRGVDDLISSIQDYIHLNPRNQFANKVLPSALVPPSIDSTQSENIESALDEKPIKVGRLAILGAPNSGKSTLLNTLVGHQRSLVTDVPGTTIDPVDAYFSLEQIIENFEELEETDVLQPVDLDLELDETDDMDIALPSELSEDELPVAPQETDMRPVGPIKSTVWFKITDTAGIRKAKNIKHPVEAQSVYRSLRAISESDIVIYMVDSLKGLGHQDRRLIDVALEKGNSLILCFNKFDLFRRTPEMNTAKKRQEWIKDIYALHPWLEFCPILLVSAKTGQHLDKLKQMILQTHHMRTTTLPTSQINKCIHAMVDHHPIFPVKGARKPFKIRYASMVKTSPPTFLLFSNYVKDIPVHYKRYLRNGLRKYFNLINTPIHLIFRHPNQSDSTRRPIQNKPNHNKKPNNRFKSR